MIHTTPSRLRMFAGLLLLSIMACKKLPNELPCGCEPDPPAYKKGGPSRPLAVCGTLHLPIDSTQGPGAMINVMMGGAVMGMYNLAELGPNKTVPFGGISTFQVYSVGYHFSLTGVIMDLKHNPLVQLQDSKWFVYKNNIGRYNYDANGLEVYDKLGHIALCIDGLHSKWLYVSSLTIEGIMPESDTTVRYFVLADLNMGGILAEHSFPYGTTADYNYFYHLCDSIPIQPIFRYTGANWQHARL